MEPLDSEPIAPKRVRVTLQQLIQGKELSPAALADFMRFLEHEVYNAEYLQFFLFVESYDDTYQKLKLENADGLTGRWHRADEVRSKESIPNLGSVSSFPPPPSLAGLPSMPSTTSVATQQSGGEFSSVPSITSLGGRSLRSVVVPFENPFESIELHPLDEERPAEIISAEPDVYDGHPLLKDLTSQAVRTYIYSGVDSLRELNLSDSQKRQVLYALKRCNHPSAFGVALRQVEQVLEKELVPAFNTFLNQRPDFQRPANSLHLSRVRYLGAFLIGVGLVVPAVLALIKLHPTYRILGLLPLIPGIILLYCALLSVSVAKVVSETIRGNRDPSADLSLQIFPDADPKLTRKDRLKRLLRDLRAFKITGLVSPEVRYGVRREGLVILQGCFFAVAIGLLYVVFMLAIPRGNRF